MPHAYLLLPVVHSCLHSKTSHPGTSLFWHLRSFAVQHCGYGLHFVTAFFWSNASCKLIHSSDVYWAATMYLCTKCCAMHEEDVPHDARGRNGFPDWILHPALIYNILSSLSHYTIKPSLGRHLWVPGIGTVPAANPILVTYDGWPFCGRVISLSQALFPKDEKYHQWRLVWEPNDDSLKIPTS